MKAPNPTDLTEYALIDTFNRAGNINANPTPTLGIDWDAKSSALITTNAAGYLNLDASSYPGADTYATFKAGKNKKHSFSVSFQTLDKSLFYAIRNNLLSPRGSFVGAVSIEIRLRDVGADLMLTVFDSTGSLLIEIFPETRIGDALGTVKTPVLIEDTGAAVIVKVAALPAITVTTSLYKDEEYVIIGGNATNGVRIYDLRIW